MITRKEQIIHNGGSPANRNARRICLGAFEEALDAVDPSRCIQSSMSVTPEYIIVDHVKTPLSPLRGIFVLAVGKASASMMRAALRILGDFQIRGILVAPRNEKAPTFDNRIETFHCGHPIPDREGLRASRRVVQAVSGLNEDELLLCLISGGASATLPAPVEEISLQDKITITNQLAKRGATIHEINTVRRHLSRLKGGRLVELSRASTVLSLIISDVPGNHLPDIGSGLTVEDPTSYSEAVEVLKRHDLWRETPPKIRNYLLSGVRGVIPETPKPGSPTFQRVHNFIIADNKTACKAVQRALRRRKLRARILSTSAELEAREMGRLLASFVAKPNFRLNVVRRSNAMIVGGECVVRVTGKGEGGRNQEVTLSAVEGMEGLDGSVIAGIGTDGIDGNSMAAGAIVDGNTALRAKRKKLDPNHFLARNDSASFFRRLGDALVTGPTGTNVGDIYVMISLR